MEYKIGFVGFGKRAKNTYLPVIKKLHPMLSVVGFWVRSPSKGQAIALENGLKFIPEIEKLLTESPDCLIVSVPSDAQYEVLSYLGRYDGTILIETPVFDHKIVDLALDIGVLEQWPCLPLEQYKELLYEKGALERPFMVQNDCRSLDYHAISQLRTYLGRDIMPVYAVAQGISTHMPTFNDKSGKERSANESWDMGLVKMSNGSVISHNFAYNCKVAPFRMVQTLRAYSTNGTIITGMITEKDNDYENVDIRCLAGKDTNIFDIEFKRDASDTLIEIRDNDSGIAWINRFSNYELTDHQIAIAELLVRACEDGPLYKVKDSLIDNVIISAIRQSIHSQNVVRLGQ